ncbi:MAG: response regulator, partial [Paraburkholderia sp.]|uniref:response regulator n=1 Tax=Paraburkholderia sp. TaxID=1926495 RepID=UPI003C425169
HCGATFTITLPTAAKPLGEPVAPAPVAGRPDSMLTILLIEDHVDTADVMAQLIRGMGHEVTVAGRVDDALAATQSTTYDLIVSDVGLPDGTGLDFIKAFREHSGAPAVALTGFGTDEDVRRCLAAGFTSHLTKPVNFLQLEQLIENAANVKAEKAQGPDSA